MHTNPDWRRRHVHLTMRCHKCIAGTLPVIRVTRYWPPFSAVIRGFPSCDGVELSLGSSWVCNAPDSGRDMCDGSAVASTAKTNPITRYDSSFQAVVRLLARATVSNETILEMYFPFGAFLQLRVRSPAFCAKFSGSRFGTAGCALCAIEIAAIHRSRMVSPIRQGIANRASIRCADCNLSSQI